MQCSQMPPLVLQNGFRSCTPVLSILRHGEFPYVASTSTYGLARTHMAIAHPPHPKVPMPDVLSHRLDVLSSTLSASPVQ